MSGENKKIGRNKDTTMVCCVIILLITFRLKCLNVRKLFTLKLSKILKNHPY